MAWCLSVIVCLCLSQFDVVSNRIERIGLFFLAWRLLLTTPTLCYKDVQVSAKVRVLPSGTLS